MPSALSPASIPLTSERSTARGRGDVAHHVTPLATVARTSGSVNQRQTNRQVRRMMASLPGCATITAKKAHVEKGCS
jgi:hypothetical protein